ncbi:hypothetical protein CASFOL_038001 [Castilleja foliolosa]|uniref:Uncharacterized protein n=1 Tax=Castilleja foliolosa TaxID=1961234 RepID=A0ABD3BLR8_9LAMI
MKLVTVWWPLTVRKLVGKSLATAEGVEGIQMRKIVKTS